MKKNILRKAAAAGLALMLLITLTPSMGLVQMFFTVTYYPNAPGNQSPRVDNASVSYIVKDNPFSNPGFTFIGWNSNSSGTGTVYMPGLPITMGANLSLYAIWRPVQGERVKITYKANAGDNQADVIDDVARGNSYAFRTNPFFRAGYTFTGWNTQANGFGITYMPGNTTTVNADWVLYAQWQAEVSNTVTITYKANAGDNQADVVVTVIRGSSHTLRTNPYTRAGYSFTGWNTQANGLGIVYTPGQTITVSNNLTLFAQWQQTGTNTITITYKANGGNGQDVVDTVIRGSSYTVRANLFTRAGYTFVNWNTQANGLGAGYNPGQTITAPQSNQTVYAQWQVAQAEQVTITYMPNGGNGQANVVDTVNRGSSYTVRTNPYTRSGYTFVNWNTQANGNGTAVNPGQTFTLNANQVLYAQWRADQAAQVTITYLPNGGNGQANVTDTVNRGSSYTIRPNIFTRSGYVFNGWNTQANGFGTTMSPGQVMIADNNYTLYAQWVTDDMIVEIPTGVDGRILPPWKSGDDCNWIEIARNGKYSLIVRSVRVASANFSPSNNSYWTSHVRGVCNNFFNTIKVYNPTPTPITLSSVLPQIARLRDYTVENDALFKLGTSSNFASLSDGYSKPTRFYARAGNDICFALSYTEAANFLSRARWLRGANPAIQPSPNLAISNYLKISPIPQTYPDIWLRSPGDVHGTAAAITYSETLNHGTAFQRYAVAGVANIHPALWVYSSVFD